MVARLPIRLLLAAFLLVAIGCANEDVTFDSHDTGTPVRDAGSVIECMSFGRNCPPDTICNFKTCECEHICEADRGGCRKLEVCDHSSPLPNGKKPCIPMTCGRKLCEFGQGCFDAAHNFSRGAAECSCIPTLKSPEGDLLVEDTCAAYGKVCDYDPETKAPARCVSPDTP
jgi:hypothetical protein